jgi:outer membrane protein assembly factor BamB
VAGVPCGGVDPVYVVGTDGFLRVLRASDGTDAAPGMPFVPPGAMPSALVFIDGAIYTTTSNGCGASPNGVWMIDTTTPEHAVTSWLTGGPNLVGRSGLAFGTDATIFVATGPAPAATSGGKPSAASQFADSIVALDPSTLTVKDWFSAPGARFNTSPMVVRHDNRDLVFAAADDGRMYVLDSGSLGGADHRTPLHATAAYSDAGAGGSLATWESQGTRWILAPAIGTPKPGLTFAANGPAPVGKIVAFTLAGTAGTPTLEPAWASRSVPSPLGPIVVNGVVFAAASGNRTTRAVLYALDGDTGRELWTSRAAITSFAQGALVAGSGQVYVVTYDNSLYAFGIPMEH